LAEGYQALGFAYQYKGWNRRALEMEQKAVELNPNSAHAAGLLGRMLWMSGRLDESLYWVKKYHELDPTSKLAYRYVADVYRMLGNFTEAKRWYGQCLALDPAHRECTANLMTTYMLEGNKQEVQALEFKLLSIDATHPEVLEMARDAEFFLGNYQKATEYSKKLPEDWLDVDDGYSFLKIGNRTEAAKAFDTALKYRQARIAEKSEASNDFTTIGAIHAISGNKTDAYKMLQNAIDSGFIEYRWLLISPVWENLRGDQQFQQIIAQLKARVEEMRKRAEQQEHADMKID
jgi:tetratricopeptide (TPR) repeat protein